MGTPFYILAAFIAGIMFGWIQAHLTVAEECKKLGRFFVGDTVYECWSITKKDEKQP